MALDIKTAGLNFVSKVIKLYRSEKYFREKEILANKLLEHAVEAGRLTNEISTCEEYEESGFAVRALEELSKATFALKIMSEEGVYPRRKVQPVLALGDELKELLKLYVNSEASSRVQEADVQTADVQEADVQTKVQQTAVLGGAEPAPAPENEIKQLPLYVDDGGFNEVYTGKL